MTGSMVCGGERWLFRGRSPFGRQRLCCDCRGECSVLSPFILQDLAGVLRSIDLHSMQERVRGPIRQWRLCMCCCRQFPLPCPLRRREPAFRSRTTAHSGKMLPSRQRLDLFRSNHTQLSNWRFASLDLCYACADQATAARSIEEDKYAVKDFQRSRCLADAQNQTRYRLAACLGRPF